MDFEKVFKGFTKELEARGMAELMLCIYLFGITAVGKDILIYSLRKEVGGIR